MNAILLVLAWSLALLVTLMSIILVVRDDQSTQTERRASTVLLVLASVFEILIIGILI